MIIMMMSTKEKAITDCEIRSAGWLSEVWVACSHTEPLTLLFSYYPDYPAGLTFTWADVVGCTKAEAIELYYQRRDLAYLQSRTSW